jgi:hypothetical protein
MERFRIKGKNLAWLGLICLECIGLYSFSGELVNRQRLQKSYTAEVGVREATGHNDGTRVESYLSVTGLGKGYPWCAAFVAWNFKMCNIPAPKSAYSPDWFKSNVIYKQGWEKGWPVCKPGMVFGLYYENLKRIGHVGFVDYEDKNNIYTTEGNTNSAGSREGEGVHKKIRKKSTIYKIADYIKP